MSRFQAAQYTPQFGIGNPHDVPNAADLAFESALQVAFDAIQVLIGSVSFRQPGRTDAAQMALLRVSNATLVSAATIAALGVSAVPSPNTGGNSYWSNAVNWVAGLTACQALLPSL
jgi:hypothetical protein